LAQHYLGFSWPTDYKKLDEGQLKEREIAAPSGAAVMFRKDVYEKIGGLDGNFFLYCEDTDLGWRLRLMDYKIMFAPKAVIWHKYEFHRTKTKFYFEERNRLMMLFKNYSRRTLFLLLPGLIVVEMGIFLFSLFQRWPHLKLKSWFWLITNYSKLAAGRRAVQSVRKIPDREIVNIFTDRFDYEEINTPFKSLFNKFLTSYWRLVRGMIR